MVDDGSALESIFALRGKCPQPQDEYPSKLVLEPGDIGFEPMLTDPESVVLPLDESPLFEEC